jgi:hypothetical protein
VGFSEDSGGAASSISTSASYNQIDSEFHGANLDIPLESFMFATGRSNPLVFLLLKLSLSVVWTLKG